MEGIEIQVNKKPIDRILDDLDLFDDSLMSMAFDRNIEATELLLRILLKRSDIKVISVIGQKEFQNPEVHGRGIRLDILAIDSTGKYYNVEVQKSPEGANIRRARFNSSMLDTRMLKEGQDFNELQDSYMIFVTQTDIFGHGLPIYTINRHFEEFSGVFDDGSHIIYVNGSYKGDDPVGRLMHDFRCKKSEDIYYEEIAKCVKHFKEEEGGRTEMSEMLEKYADKKAELAISDDRRKTVKRMLERGKTPEEISDFCGYELKFVKQVEESFMQTV